MKNFGYQIFLLCALFHFSSTQSTNTSKIENRGFGPYKVITRTYASCDSKIFSSEAIVNGSLKVMKISRTEEDYRGSFTFKKDLKINRGKLISEILVGSKFVPDYNHTTDKPCESLFFLPVLKVLLRADSSCTVKKGTYNIQNINPHKIVQAIFSAIQQTQYQVHFELDSINGVAICFDITIEIQGVKKKNKH